MKETSFKVHDVEKSTQLFETESGSTVQDYYSNKIIAASIEDIPFVKGTEYTTNINQFLYMLSMGYNDHKSVVITPDILWLLICQGFAEHVKKKSWSLKFRLVKFLFKKQKLTVDMGSKENWNEVVSDICDQISNYTRKDLKSKLVLDFSTTSAKEKMAFEIAFMDSVSKFFEYEGISICGFPEIKLRGTVEDYEKILSSLDFMAQYGLKWWVKSLKKVLQEIINTLNGTINQDFWKRIYVYELNNMSGGKSKVTGWITYFFPYIKGTNRKGIKKKMIKNPYIFNKRSAILDLHDFTSGLSKVDFKWIEGAEEKDLKLVSGFIGVKENPVDGFLETEINWYVEEK